MQQFRVPQFIDVEPKIIGSITVRQFLELLAGLFIAIIAFALFDFTLFLVVFVLDLVIVALLAFYQPNGVPFHFFFLNFIEFMMRPTTRVWNRYTAIEATEKEQKKKEKVSKKKGEDDVLDTVRSAMKTTRQASLSELSLIVDTGGLYKGE